MLFLPSTYNAGRKVLIFRDKPQLNAQLHSNLLGVQIYSDIKQFFLIKSEQILDALKRAKTSQKSFFAYRRPP